ncbi:Integrase catalytic domain-containing protein [Trichostrongylus colubriformis]|uniref:Integrase catalytic domain-containing protein n=2 Tax=Trichostrongylus colubriformis TaxID=6319 RepID=A0AAN8FTB1_TRICO
MSPENWPVKDASNLREQSDDEEAETCYHASVSTVQVRHPVWSLESTNDYSKVIRVTAYCARFIRNASKGKCLSLKNKALVTITPSAEEAILAEQLLIRQEQATFKSEELLQNKQVNVNVDDKGIIRKYSRLQNADISFDIANPVHIPKQSKLGYLIAYRLHKEASHCGINQLLYDIRQKYWIPQDRLLCKRILKHCVVCRKQNAAPYRYPNMGPLPTERISKSPPFSHTGVDFMGPIIVKSPSGEDCQQIAGTKLKSAMQSRGCLNTELFQTLE